MAAPRPAHIVQRPLPRLNEARGRTDALFAVLRPEAYYDRPIAERHRIVFYLGHLEAFDWNLLSSRGLDLKSFYPEFDRLFAFGIDPVDGGLPSDRPQDWPAINEVRRYNERVRRELDRAVEKLGPSERILDGDTSLVTLLNVAIEHRMMHAETFAYMLHQLPMNRKVVPQSSKVPSSPTPKSCMVEIPAGEATLGLERNGFGDFGWDNEFESHRVGVPAFSIDRYSVTQGEFLKFVENGGYQDRSFWTSDGWDWIQEHGIQHPAFWIQAGNEWHYRTMFGEVPLRSEWPVYVSQAEATAFARWAGKSIPTEGEWHRAAYGTPEGHERLFPWGEKPPTSVYGNFDFHQWDPSPVDTHPAGASAFGVMDLIGNGWEWTSTPFGPFPGFRPFSFYPGYSANFFDGKHYVMKGGSARTAACMLRRSFRNWFQPHYPYVYAKFRCVAR
jgi:gamma-glutamyl hercynylcysteine S-oxide synthase